MKNKKFVAICIMALFLMTMFAGTINAEKVEMKEEAEEDIEITPTAPALWHNYYMYINDFEELSDGTYIAHYVVCKLVATTLNGLVEETYVYTSGSLGFKESQLRGISIDTIKFFAHVFPFVPYIHVEKLIE